jgi:rod shape-determining protein MreD
MRFIILLLLVCFATVIQIGIVPSLFPGSENFNLPLLLVIGISFFRSQKEAIFWAFFLGLLLDTLEPYLLGWAIFVFPLIALANSYLLKKFWGKPGVIPFITLTILFSFFYQLLLFSSKTFLLSGEETFFGLFLANSTVFLLDALKSMVLNGFFLGAFFYFLFFRLDQLFDYWEQKRKI